MRYHWLAGKLQRLEEERQAHVSQLEAQDFTLEDMDKQTHELQSQANTALQNLKEVCHCRMRMLCNRKCYMISWCDCLNVVAHFSSFSAW